MRLRTAASGRASSSDETMAAAAAARGAARSPPLAAAEDARGAVGPLPRTAAGAQRHNGSNDESFFEARPWLDSDSEDDFYSVRGDFTPSRGSTPDHQRLASFSGRVADDRSKPPLVVKKQRLLDLLQEEQHYDDEDGSASDLEGSAVYAEENLKASRDGVKAKKSSNSGCLPSLLWKHGFGNRKKNSKEQKHKVN